jgi:hypothetical protein
MLLTKLRKTAIKKIKKAHTYHENEKVENPHPS